MSGSGCRMEEKTRAQALTFLPLIFQAGGPGKNCPDVAVPHRQCLSWRSCKHFLLPWAVHLSGCILAMGKEPAQVSGLA